MLNTKLQEHERAAVQSLVERIYIDRASIALLGRDTTGVDDFGRHLVQVLRQEAHLEVVVLFDVAEDKLIDRINQRLAPLSVDQARSAQGVEQPPQVWVLQVQGDAQLSQVQMLTRLIRDFPAANLSLLLLSSPKIADAFLDSPLGRFFVQWRLPEPEAQTQPAAEEKQPPVEVPIEPAPKPAKLQQVLSGLRSPKAPFMVAGVALLLLLISLVAGRH